MNRFGGGFRFRAPLPVIEANESQALTQRLFVLKSFGWMTLALAITGIVAYSTAANFEAFAPLLQGPGRLVLFFAQIGLVVGLSAGINKMSAGMATGLFLLYSAVTGFMLSMLFVSFTAASLASTFFVTSATFGLVAAYGMVTRADLTRFGNLLFMALLGLLLATVVNMFLGSSMVSLITSAAGVLIFTGLVAYDAQQLKAMALAIGQDDDMQRKGAVLGALRLYLDFINLFIYMLRFMGRRR